MCHAEFSSASPDFLYGKILKQVQNDKKCINRISSCFSKKFHYYSDTNFFKIQNSMTQNYKTKPGSKVEFMLTVTDEQVGKHQKEVINMFRSQVGTKGFRKGHAPDDVVVAQVGAQRISFESLNRAIDTEYKKFIDENNLRPISQPKVDMKDPNKKPLEITCEVEVYPEVSVGDYKKIKMDTIVVDVQEDEVDKVIREIMNDMGLAKEVERAAKDGDRLVVSFEGTDEKGNVLPQTAAKEIEVNVGGKQFLEDLEKAFVGMKAGEEKKAVMVKFPKDYHAKDMAGKKISFDVTVHEVKELNPENLSEDQIHKMIGGKMSLEEMKGKVQEMIRGRKEEEERRNVIDNYNKKLAKIVKTELPQSWIEDDIDMRIRHLKNSPQFKQAPDDFWKAIGKTEDAVKKEFRKPAEENLKIFLGLSHIIDNENIELDKDEVENAKKSVEMKKKQNSNMDEQMELSKALHNLKIDKFFRGLTLEA